MDFRNWWWREGQDLYLGSGFIKKSKPLPWTKEKSSERNPKPFFPDLVGTHQWRDRRLRRPPRWGSVCSSKAAASSGVCRGMKAFGAAGFSLARSSPPSPTSPLMSQPVSASAAPALRALCSRYVAGHLFLYWSPFSFFFCPLPICRGSSPNPTPKPDCFILAFFFPKINGFIQQCLRVFPVDHRCFVSSWFFFFPFLCYIYILYKDELCA